MKTATATSICNEESTNEQPVSENNDIENEGGDNSNAPIESTKNAVSTEDANTDVSVNASSKGIDNNGFSKESKPQIGIDESQKDSNRYSNDKVSEVSSLNINNENTYYSDINTIEQDYSINASEQVNLNSVSDWMPDVKLQSAVYDSLHDLGQATNDHGGYITTAVDQITQEMMTDLRYFSASNKDITDLTGLQFATGLISADFSGNVITESLPDFTVFQNLVDIDLGEVPSIVSNETLPNGLSQLKHVTVTTGSMNYGLLNAQLTTSIILNTDFLNATMIKDDNIYSGKIYVPLASVYQGYLQSDGTYAYGANLNVVLNDAPAGLSYDSVNRRFVLDLILLGNQSLNFNFEIQDYESGIVMYTGHDSFEIAQFPVSIIPSINNDVDQTIIDQLITLNQYGKTLDLNSQIENLQNYIETQLPDETGVLFESYQDAQDKQTEITETSGLYLLALALDGNSQKFDKYYQAVKARFYNATVNGFSWSYNATTGILESGSASIDDLRIIQAMLILNEKDNNTERISEVNNLISGFIGLSLNSDYLMTDGSDFSGHQESQIRLDYIDLSVLQYIYELKGLNTNALQEQLSIIENGYLGDDFPWYKTFYDYNTGLYSLNEVEGTLNITDSLLVMLNLAKVGKLQTASLNWLKDNTKNETIYNNYYPDGTPVEKNTAASTYAYVAQIASVINDEALYTDAVNVLKNMLDNDATSPLFGSTAYDGQSAAFNDLNVLVAFLS
ncbi:hypothetical protein FC07_GL000166 [Loigolactobacillus bifermentans DSM 20003]|uniref:Uncharacterized protein n=1 Tax=Loigolactobacillus bifermentans DSM 20003 TaxID=1423726 RepID=A0A0R1GN10_9LACO|nr:hypothetical protein FC07_GL000166 [Loigolactobacillus bifermentans DSM 20003]